ncbi:MAG: hypothetical protein LBT09_09135 [Planctomycetaceae bacterium]|nr:hypothetical protein [Planctomycetaceae bacterium]
MKTRNFIATACLGTVICVCILCSGIANAQPEREFRGENRQGELRKNIRNDFNRQIEEAYKRGFKDGVDVGKNLDKGKRSGEGKNFRNENYKGRHNSGKNFRNEFKHAPAERFHAHGGKNAEHVKHFTKQDFHKTGRNSFAPRNFARGKFHREGFDQAPPKKFQRGEFDRVAKGEFHKGDFHKGEFHKGEFRKGDFRKGEFRKGDFNPRSGKRGELARGHEGKRNFAAPDTPKHERNKKGTNKREDQKKPSRPHLPFGDRS